MPSGSNLTFYESKGSAICVLEVSGSCFGNVKVTPCGLASIRFINSGFNKSGKDNITIL